MIVVTAFVFILVLGGLVLLHEVGHFFAARFFGVGIDEFGIGFPPRAKSFIRNGVVYSLNWIPIGGFVKIKGAVGGDQDDSIEQSSAEGKNFVDIPLWQRFTIIGAGIGMNWLIAAVLFSVGFMFGLPSSTANLSDNAIVDHQQVVVAEIQKDVPAHNSGLQVGDVVTSVSGTAVRNVEEIRNVLSEVAVGQAVDVEVERADTVTDLRMNTIALDNGATGLGVAFTESGIVRYGFFSAIGHGFSYTAQLTQGVVMAFAALVLSVFQGDGSVAESVAGPLGIATLTYEVTQLGFVYVLQFAALLSVNLAVFNLLPIPALDGGRLVFLFLELVLRRPVKPITEAIIHNIGFLVLLLMILAVTIKDVFSFF